MCAQSAPIITVQPAGLQHVKTVAQQGRSRGSQDTEEERSRAPSSMQSSKFALQNGPMFRWSQCRALGWPVWPGNRGHRNIIPRAKRDRVAQRVPRRERVKSVRSGLRCRQHKSVGQSGQIGGAGRRSATSVPCTAILLRIDGQMNASSGVPFPRCYRTAIAPRRKTALIVTMNSQPVRQQQATRSPCHATRTQARCDAAHLQIKVGVDQSGIAADPRPLDRGRGKCRRTSMAVQIGLGDPLKALISRPPKGFLFVFAIRDRLVTNVAICAPPVAG